jgi:hypothetical protein
VGSGTGASRQGRRSRPYRKHRPLPALIVIGVLGLVSAFVWSNALSSTDDLDEAIRCEPAPTAPPGVTFTPLERGALNDARPVPPNRVAVQVLNAGGARGEASITTATLRELGFTEIGEPANDPAYKGVEAACHGQVRFGEKGREAARTVSLIDPCLELIRDNREDASVDLIIGTAFGDVHPTREALQILEQLNAWSQEHQGGSGSEQSAGRGGPALDPKILANAREGHC